MQRALEACALSSARHARYEIIARATDVEVQSDRHEPKEGTLEVMRPPGRAAITLIMANCVFGLGSCGGSGDAPVTATAAPTPPVAPPPPPAPAPPSAPTPPPVTYTASLSWSAPSLNTDGTPLTDISGYRVHYGTSQTDLSLSILVSGAANTNYAVSGLAPGTYYFAVATLNSTGVASVVSAAASKTV